MKLKQQCHGARRRLHSRALLGSLVLASASLNACGDDHGEDSADLQAILHDGDLTQLMRSTLMAAPPDPGTGTAGTSGACRAPAARRAPAAAGAPGTGIAGSIGTAGTGIGGRGTAGTGFAGTGFGGSVGGTGVAARPVASLAQAQGFWRFDDCNMNRTELGDSTFSATTRRSAR